MKTKLLLFLCAFTMYTTNLMAAMPTDINQYSSEGIVKDCSNNNPVPMKYLAYRDGSQYGYNCFNILVFTPSGEEKVICTVNDPIYNPLYSTVEYWQNSYVKIGDYVFFDLQSIESGTWQLARVQPNAGDWYYYDDSPTIIDISVYDDCSKNGYTKVIDPKTGIAPVLSSSGRTSCEWVQLWENGPKWATFNVGATITNYGNLMVGADPTPFGNYEDQAPYYNTINVGGLYPWNNPNLNGRKTSWTYSVSTGISDVATTLWGSNWTTPTKGQLDTLNDDTYTIWTWCDGNTTQYVPNCTLKGYMVTGKGKYANNSIFLPASGIIGYEDGTVDHASHSGDYWSSLVYNTNSAEDIDFDSSSRNINGSIRKIGLSVRAVLAK